MELVDALKGLSPRERKERSEEDIKKDFLMPLFAALRWDTANRKVKEEVVAERHVGNRKRVDYAFRLNGVTCFYLEAKDLKDDLGSLEILDQAVNYAYLKGVPWAVVSNFERTIVLEADSEVDSSRERVHLDLLATDYVAHLNELWLLSKPSMEAGALNDDATRRGRRARRIRVGEQLLDDLTTFREALSKDILRLNREKVSTDENALDEAVQRILDRLLFIRSTEDRGLEERRLLSIARDEDKDHLDSKLRDLFEDYDEAYDSELFERTLADEVRIDPELVERVVRGLYFAAGKSVEYDFGVIGSDVLGEVYEQYLGFILLRTAKRAALAPGHAHRKEEGVYYTPTYIVNHIISSTVGELLQDADESQVRRIRVIDPACGSGSFLMKAYDAIEAYWRGKRSIAFDQHVLVDDSEDMTFSRRSDIVRNNIFGVDKDARAAEIARLNLLLRISERRKRLPILKNNIRTGDSLAFGARLDGSGFDWNREFPEAMSGGGFDVVIGNPPWSAKIPGEEKATLAKTFGLPAQNMNICSPFVLRGLSLVRPGGYFGFLLPKVFVKNDAYEIVRRKLLDDFDLTRIWDFGRFPGVASDAVGVVARRATAGRKTRVFALQGQMGVEQDSIDQATFKNATGTVFTIGATNSVLRVLQKLEAGSVALGDLFAVERGIEVGQSSILLKCPSCGDYNETGKKYYGPTERRCGSCGLRLPKTGGELLPFCSGVRNSDYPRSCFSGKKLQRYLLRPPYFVPRSVKGVDYKEEEFRGPLLLLKRIATRPVGTFVKDNQLCLNTVYGLTPRAGVTQRTMLATLGLLNSELMSYYYEKTYVIGMDLTTQLTKEFLRKLPIRSLPGDDTDQIARLTNELVNLGGKLAAFGSTVTNQRQDIERRFAQTDQYLEKTIGEAYGLTRPEQRMVIEEARTTGGNDEGRD